MEVTYLLLVELVRIENGDHLNIYHGSSDSLAPDLWGRGCKTSDNSHDTKTRIKPLPTSNVMYISSSLLIYRFLFFRKSLVSFCSKITDSSCTKYRTLVSTPFTNIVVVIRLFLSVSMIKCWVSGEKTNWNHHSKIISRDKWSTVRWWTI